MLGLSTLRGLCGVQADNWLERYAHVAPKQVLGALSGRAEAPSYAPRTALFDTGREVIDSIRGQDDEGAWTLRERALARWPSTVAHSLLDLSSPRAADMAERCRQRAARDLHVLRRLQALAEWPRWPAWARPRRGDDWAADFLDD